MCKHQHTHTHTPTYNSIMKNEIMYPKIPSWGSIISSRSSKEQPQGPQGPPGGIHAF